MHRRRFLARASGLSLLTVLWGCEQRTPSPRDLALRPSLLDSMGEDMVRRLGTGYLAMLGVADADQERLLFTRLQRAVERARGLPWLSTPSMDHVVARDFSGGHTVFVDGWLLAESEACQCALFARQS